jgi:hypothetical protein
MMPPSGPTPPGMLIYRVFLFRGFTTMLLKLVSNELLEVFTATFSWFSWDVFLFWKVMEVDDCDFCRLFDLEIIDPTLLERLELIVTACYICGGRELGW